MAADNSNKSEGGLLAMINNALVGRRPSSDQSTPAPDSEPQPVEVQPPAIEEPRSVSSAFEPRDRPPSRGPTGPVVRRMITAEQMEGVIRKALSDLPEFGEGHGISIVVYGYTPWNVLLQFRPGAISVTNADVVKKAVTLSVEMLRLDFDIEMPGSG
jgi:hypothetical protein